MKPRQILLLSALCVLGVVNCSASLSYAPFNESPRQSLLEFCSVSSSEFGVRVPCLQERLLDAPMAPAAPASIIEAHAQSAPPKGVFALQKIHSTTEWRTTFPQELICSDSAGSK